MLLKYFYLFFAGVLLFAYTETYQQLISYAGLSPKEYSSGSSIRGRLEYANKVDLY